MNTVPGIDFEAGLELVGGDQEILDMILVTYYEEGEPTINNIRKAYEENNIKDYTTYTHGLKSASRSVGANALGDHAFEHEKMGKENNVEGIAADVENLIGEFEILLENLKTYLEANDLM